MFIAFAMEGFGIYMLYLWGSDPVWFVLLSGFVFFAWGEIYSLFPRPARIRSARSSPPRMPACCTRPRGTAALLVPFANYLQQSSGNWDGVFLPRRAPTSWPRSWQSRC